MALPAWIPIISYAVVVLLFIGIYSFVRIENETEQKPFSSLVFVTTLVLVSDAFSRLYVFDGFPHWIVELATYIDFAALALIGLFWYRFMRSVLSLEERTRARRLDIVTYVIVGIALIDLALNPFFGTVFSFDAAGDYHRGVAFYVPAAATFICIVISEAFVVLRVRSLNNNEFTSMVLFPVPPLIGGIVDMYVYGIPWLALGASLSMVILFSSFHTASLGKDFLTGVSTRRRLDERLNEYISRAERGRGFAAILVDLDDFKMINDTHGHSVGDAALAEAAHILSSCVREEDEVARIGGDEFVILVDKANEQTIAELAERIQDAAARFNAQNPRYDLELSMGYAPFDPEVYPSPKAFLDYIDARMYAAKKQRKEAKRLATAG